MAEVFTIAGSGFGADARCPAGWSTTPNGNCGGAPPTYKSQLAADMQNALIALGRKAGDIELQNLSVDGVIGPQTVSAVNKAFGTHVGDLQTQATFRASGKLTQYQVAEAAATIVSQLRASILSKGGTLPPVSAVAPPPPRVEIGPAEIVDDRGRVAGAWALVAANLAVAGVGAWLLSKE